MFPAATVVLPTSAPPFTMPTTVNSLVSIWIGSPTFFLSTSAAVRPRTTACSLASRGIREFYLLTTTAQEYFRKRGFKVIDRDEVHPQLLGSEEFRGACPDSAVCMRLVMLA